MFGFPIQSREVISEFKRNYLKTVVFQFKFPAIKLLSKQRNEIYSKLRAIYPRINDQVESGFEIKFGNEHTPILQPIKEANSGYELRTEDGQKIISVASDTVSITIAGKVYKNFEDSQANEIQHLLSVLKLFDVRTLNRVAVRKINIIDYTIPDDSDLSPMSVLSMLIHQDLLNNYKGLPSQEHIWQNMHNINYRRANDQLNLRYGLISPDPKKPKTGQVIIDIDLFNLDNNELKNGEKKLSELNKEVFNIFRWSICADALNKLFE